ncbi:MAG: hypothetical protein IPL61_20195 [Myxococcales bacterium]|nr:hypothetical protein [Myxococcales bacterium]
MLSDESAVIVEHRHFRGARAPTRMIFDDHAELERYLADAARPGDSFWFWHYERACPSETALGHGKVPDGDGVIPEGGAY